MDAQNEKLIALVETILEKLKDRFTVSEYDFIESSLKEITNEQED